MAAMAGVADAADTAVPADVEAAEPAAGGVAPTASQTSSPDTLMQNAMCTEL
jgi:hypothetical protein